MSTSMDETTFLEFYKNTILGGSNNFQHFICKKLEAENRITFEEQRKISDKDDTLFFESKRDFKGIISKTTTTKSFINFYETLEYTKLYKYSVPFFYESGEKALDEIIKEKQISIFDNKLYNPEYIIDRELNDSTPVAYIEDGVYFLKFVLQKAYMQPDTFEAIDYRYPIVIYINPAISVLEIRYDSMRYSYNDQVDRDAYSKIVSYYIDWIKDTLGIKLFLCKHSDTMKIINDIQNTDVRIYKQMMEMKSGASAELTASENGDYMLPFLGEIRELIDENEELLGISATQR